MRNLKKIVLGILLAYISVNGLYAEEYIVYNTDIEGDGSIYEAFKEASKPGSGIDRIIFDIDQNDLNEEASIDLSNLTESLKLNVVRDLSIDFINISTGKNVIFTGSSLDPNLKNLVHLKMRGNFSLEIENMVFRNILNNNQGLRIKELINIDLSSNSIVKAIQAKYLPEITRRKNVRVSGLIIEECILKNSLINIKGDSYLYCSVDICDSSIRDNDSIGGIACNNCSLNLINSYLYENETSDYPILNVFGKGVLKIDELCRIYSNYCEPKNLDIMYAIAENQYCIYSDKKAELDYIDYLIYDNKTSYHDSIDEISSSLGGLINSFSDANSIFGA